jgi:hypothetical protein
MRICDMNTGAMQLTKAAKRLREQWDWARAHWRDQNAEDFDRDVLQPLAPQLTLTLARIHRMAQLLEQAERDCLDEEGVP